MDSVNVSNISRIDLNLLVIFQCLIHERNVTRAANSLFVTQSAVSASLKKLRHVFDDELFIRTPSGMAPTEKALEIAPIINDALLTIAKLMTDSAQKQVFFPTDTKQTFRIALSDDVECLLAKKILAAAKALQLSANFVFYQTNSHFWSTAFGDSDIDLVICANPKGVNAQYQTADLFSSSYSCIFDNQVHGLHKPMSFEHYVHGNHGRVTFDGGRIGFLDEFFEAEGYTRQVKATFSLFSSAVNAVVGSDLILTMPLYTTRTFAENNSKLMVSPVPFKLAPTFAVQMIWDVKTKHDVANQWLRQFIIDITKDLKNEFTFTP